jgi:hypothetical protein
MQGIANGLAMITVQKKASDTEGHDGKRESAARTPSGATRCRNGLHRRFIGGAAGPLNGTYIASATRGERVASNLASGVSGQAVGLGRY